VYVIVAVTALAGAGPVVLAHAAAPLAAAVRLGDFDALVPLVRAGAVIAALGVLLSLIAGVSRTTFAMAAEGDLPGWFDAVHPRHKVPHRAELAVAAIVVAIVLVADVRHAIGFSSFCVLTYYAIANASAWTLPAEQLRWPRAFAALGFVGCTVLAFSLPLASVVTGAGVLGVGALAYAARRALAR
jgi:APA family basic amino acid/polyamine antiporter